jgi:beta-lactamase regulating signal transducer with metallopeptidase domain
MNGLQALAQVSVERLANAVPEGFLIALFAWLLLRILRKQNSGTRFAVWFLALLTIAALPLLAFFGKGHLPMSLGLSSGSSRPAISIPSHWALLVFTAWALGALVALMRLGAGLWRLQHLRRSCIPIDAATLDPLVRNTLGALVAHEPSPSRAITVATSEFVRVPSAIGFWNRTIVLPGWALRELPAPDLNVILLHEFAHLRRADDWTNLVQKFVRAIFFFHPAVWWIEKQLSVEREMACDDAVLAETANPHGYATCLVSLLEKSLAHRLANKHLSAKHWSMAHAAVHRAQEAALRLAKILDKNRPAATRVWKPALGMIGGFALICLLALPPAPQFVAFDRGVVSNSDSAYSIASGRSSTPTSWRGPAVIPAAFNISDATLEGANISGTKIGETKIGQTSARPSSNTTARAVNTRAVPAHRSVPNDKYISDNSVSQVNADRDRLMATSTDIDSAIAPQFQTLVFVEATRLVDSSAQVWTVQVWRVTFVSAVYEKVATVPVANSI